MTEQEYNCNYPTLFKVINADIVYSQFQLYYYEIVTLSIELLKMLNFKVYDIIKKGVLVQIQTQFRITVLLCSRKFIYSYAENKFFW